MLAVATAVLAVWSRKEAKKHGTGTLEEMAGICLATLERSSQKEVRKAEALALVRERGEIGNREIREILGVSRNSVVNYMTELEKEGEIDQVGDIGRGVTYRLKTLI